MKSAQWGGGAESGGGRCGKGEAEGEESVGDQGIYHKSILIPQNVLYTHTQRGGDRGRGEG